MRPGTGSAIRKRMAGGYTGEAGWGQTVKGFLGHTRNGQQGTKGVVCKEKNNI